MVMMEVMVLWRSVFEVMTYLWWSPPHPPCGGGCVRLARVLNCFFGLQVRYKIRRIIYLPACCCWEVGRLCRRQHRLSSMVCV